jgi:thioesterase domain-containing protein/acyl dehydratase
LFLEIESSFGVRLPPSTLFTAGTLGGLARLIKNDSDNTEPAAITRWQEGGKLPPLFLVHTIDVHVPHLKKLVETLDPELPVFALEPIRNTDAIGREFNVDSLVKQYALEIRRAHPNGVYSLGGWSIGGFMAFSVAAELESSGDSPAALMLIDASSASLRPKIRQRETRILTRFFKFLRRRLRREVEALRLSPAEQWERFTWIYDETRRKLRALSQSNSKYRSPANLHRDFARIVDQYQPQPFHGPVTLFRSYQKTVDGKLNHDLGWGEFTSGKLDVVHIPGDHNSMVMEPQNRKMLASHMMHIINQTVNKTADRSAKSVVENAMLDEFLLETSKLSGQIFIERVPWNNVVTPDTIRHFAYGICDDNPLWLDHKYANNNGSEGVQAPPAFLISARYPILHGAPIDVPLISLLRDIEFTWERRIPKGEKLFSSTTQGEVREIVDPGGHRRVYVEAQTRYWNGKDQLLGQARATVVRMLNQGNFRVDDWKAHHYSADELERITGAIHAEARTGSRRLSSTDYAPGTLLPAIVRGPLNIGDMICWHAAVGPSYRPGPLGYKDTLETPQFRVKNPVTGWPIKYMLQHEDVHLAHQRGMPAPFDNGVMRFAWVTPLITNWMGDHGFLARMHITVHLPVLYGDTCWYSGEVSSVVREGEFDRVTIRISGSNQRGTISTSGSAEVLFAAQDD